MFTRHAAKGLWNNNESCEFFKQKRTYYHQYTSRPFQGAQNSLAISPRFKFIISSRIGILYKEEETFHALACSRTGGIG